MARILRTLLILLLVPALLVWLVFGLPSAKADEASVKTPASSEAPARR